MKSGILLDLDQTLVITDAIEPLRAARRWQDVYRAFDQTALPPGTRYFVGAARSIGDIGIVTTAPRAYAERLLAYHGLDLAVLVAYHDVRPHKPAPAPLLRGLQLLGVPAARCVHIGDRPEDDHAARAAGVASVLVDWTSARAGACRSWDEVLERVRVLLVLGR